MCGEVVEIGAHVSGFSLGDRVAVAPYVPCGTCELCTRGLGELCRSKAATSGALQEYVVVPQRIVNHGTFRVDDQVSDEVATLAEPLACVLNGLNRAGVSDRDKLLIVGGGPMGVLTALAASLRGASVLITESSESRIERLRQLGLDVIDATTAVLKDEMSRRWGTPHADRAIAAVGVKRAVEELESLVAPGGVVLWFGGLARDVKLSVDPFDIHYREVSIVGSFGFSTEHFAAAVDLVHNHASEISKMITHSVHISEIERAFELASAGDGLKIAITFGENDGH